PGPARPGRGHRERAGRAAPDERPGGLQAPEGPRAGRADRPRAHRAASALPAGGPGPARSRRLAVGVPALLGGEPRPPRRAPASHAGPVVTGPAGRQEIVITRVLDAPRELVWRAWTEPEHLAAWWGAPGWRTPASGIVMDVRPGGAFVAESVSEADGSRMTVRGVYREVVPPERLTLEEPAEGAWHD